MAKLDFLRREAFAHRGLHGGGIVENTREAFEAAIVAGHGVETDVQVSKDGVAFVFHDFELDRLTTETGKVIDREAELLAQIAFDDTDEKLPRLTEMLKLVNGRAPILIELKTKNRSSGGNVKELCRSVADALAAYQGEAAVMSFNAEVGRWFAKNAPNVVRGLVVTEQPEKTGLQKLKGAIRRSAAVFRAKPDFLAYDIRDFPSAFAKSLREEGMPVLTWTVRTDAQRQTAAQHTDQIIYEIP